MSLLIPGLDDYLLRGLPARDAVLAEMEEVAARRQIPIVGPAVGRLLAQLTRLMSARRVFELGSAVGYSTIWFARAVGPDGHVYFTDGSAENAEEATEWFQRAGVRDRVTVLVGDALESLAKIDGDFDIVFNDVDKEGYPAVFENAFPRLCVGGLLISDNVLWSGRLRLPAAEDDAETRAIRKFNRLMYDSDDAETTILPLRDGVALARKIR